MTTKTHEQRCREVAEKLSILPPCVLSGQGQTMQELWINRASKILLQEFTEPSTEKEVISDATKKKTPTSARLVDVISPSSTLGEKTLVEIGYDAYKTSESPNWDSIERDPHYGPRFKAFAKAVAVESVRRYTSDMNKPSQVAFKALKQAQQEIESIRTSAESIRAIAEADAIMAIKRETEVRAFKAENEMLRRVFRDIEKATILGRHLNFNNALSVIEESVSEALTPTPEAS